MKHFYAKALAVLALGASAFTANAGVYEVTGYIPEDRSGWKISGCSQCNETAGNHNDGGFAQIIDDNINTFWHSNWNPTEPGPGHYFIIDRGENAPEIKHFGYTPRMGGYTAANGYVTSARLFAVDEAPELSVCSGSWSTAPDIKIGEGDDEITKSAHDHAAEWFAANTPLVSATFDCQYNDVSTQHEFVVDLPTPTSARYLVFVMDDANGSQGNKFANCSEFKTYTGYGTYTYEVVEASDFEGKRIMFLNKMHRQYIGVKADASGNIFTGNTAYGLDAIWSLVPASEGKYKIYNEWYGYYIGHLSEKLNTRTPAVTDASEAEEWQIDYSNGYFSISSTTETVHTQYPSLHMVNWDGLVRWTSTADASLFEIAEVTADDYAAWVDGYENLCPGTIGYHSPTDEFLNALAALKADPENLDLYYPVETAAANAPVVLPAAGKYYTIRGAHEAFNNHFITEAYDRQVAVTVGSGEEAVTGNYNEVIVATAAANVVPQLWQFNQIAEGETHAGNYIITAANSGNALRCPNFGTPLAVLPLDHSDVGHYTILDEANRQFGGVTLVSPNSADKGTANINGEGPSFNSWNGQSNGNNWFIEAVDAVNVAFNAEGYAAVQFPFAVSVPEGVAIYNVVSADDERANLVAVALEVIPANTPVILSAVAETVSLPIIESDALAQAEEASALLGTNVSLVVENAFILEGKYFVPAVDGLVPANSAYIVSTSENDGLDMNFIVTGLTVNETEVTLEIGETATLVATVEPANATDAEVTWTSSDEAVATVSAEGVVTAVAEGTAVITAACGDHTATCNVTVNAPATVVAETVTLDKTALELKAGETATLVATVLPEEAEDKTVVWTSSNEAVATVSAEGVVTAVAEGTAVITAACGDIKAECTVTVVTDEPIEDLLDEIRANAAAVELYDLSGRRVLNPATGVYILRRNGSAIKVTL